MPHQTRTEPAQMAKTQKTFYLDDNLAGLIDEYQAATGVPFTRVITSAILSYLFDGLQNPDPLAPVGPDPTWMTVAWRLERGDVTLDELPEWIVTKFIEDAEEAAAIDKGNHGKPNKELVAQIAKAKSMLAMIQHHLKSMGGDKRKLILAMLRSQRFLAHGA